MKNHNIKFKKLNLVSFKDRVIKTVKTFTIGNHISDSLSVPLRQIMYLSFGRLRDLTTRATVTRNFLKLVLKLNKNHGADFTIK